MTKKTKRPAPKVRMNFRLDRDVVAWLRKHAKEANVTVTMAVTNALVASRYHHEHPRLAAPKVRKLYGL